MSDNKPKAPKEYTYEKEWEKLYPIKEVQSDIHSFFCIPCDRILSNRCAGISNVRSHCRSFRHRQNISEKIRKNFNYSYNRYTNGPKDKSTRIYVQSDDIWHDSGDH
ncbi:hypothetical protein RF11_04567 [Thelohanellus kitauei]|uniref:Uncharacterized protein n=1 Tax=Thelohanellus kitauei TaxID=669202 RepID=A0A0C2IF02_THEKT|nr:hypothetical protein RF11_04567 [Thelohanellus kitauei]